MRRQIAEDEVVVRRFAGIDAAIAATDAAPVASGAAVDITDEDVVAVRAGMAQALTAPEDHTA